jgi:hypothetical protein
VFALPSAGLPSGTAWMAIAADGTIYVAIDSEPLYALDPDGTVRWSAPLTCSGPPAIGGDGTVYVGDTISRLHAIDAQGTERWHYGAAMAPPFAMGPPSVGADGTIYIAFGRDDLVSMAMMGANLVALAPDGSPRWSGPAFYQPSFPTVAPDGDVYAAGVTGQPKGNSGIDLVEALSMTGAVRWSVTSQAGYIQPVTVGPDQSVIGVGSDSAGLQVNALGPDGGPRWGATIGIELGVPQMPAVDSSGTVYVTASPAAGPAKLSAVASGGTPLWQVELPGGPAFAPPIVDGAGVVYVATQADVIAVSPGGSILWSTTVATQATSLAIGADGTLYAGTTQGSVFAWR